MFWNREKGANAGEMDYINRKHEMFWNFSES